MSESEFNDARVLRSDETTLLLEEMRILYRNISAGESNMDDVKHLNRIWPKLEDAMGDFYVKVELAMGECKRAIVAGTSEAMANSVLNLLLNKLDASPEGQELCPDVILPMLEWQWIMDRWRKNSKFANVDREAVTKLLRIEDVITNAKGVKFIGKEKRAWVRGEPNPTVSLLPPISGDEVVAAST